MPGPGQRVRLDHLVEEQLVRVEVDRALAGPALLDRIGELNRQRLLPAIEQVLDEFDMPGQVLRIGAVHVALGNFAPGDLHRAEAVLRTRLRAALAAASVSGRDDSTERQQEGRALVAAFEHYLLHGSWPIGRAIALTTSPADMLAQLIAEDPLALVAMLRRRGSSAALLRRLVSQMPQVLLARLLHRLEPVHAAYVLTYLDEVRESHAAERLVAAGPAELAEMLWTIVLRDALQEAGLQANRKAFLLRLLGQLARSSGTALPALIAQLRRGLPRVVARRRAPGSLVAILGELIAGEPALLASGEMAELAVLLDRRGKLSTRTRAEANRLMRTAPRAQLRWLLLRLAGEDPARFAEAIEGMLPFVRAVAILWQLDPAGLPAGLDALAKTSAERTALLALAAQSADRPEGADRRAATLIAEMRGIAPDRILLPRATRLRSTRPGDRSSPVALLAATLANATGDPSPAETALLRKRLADAMAADALAARHLLRSFVAADPQRLCRQLGKPEAMPDVAAQLLAPHLHARLIALAQAASCTAAEWHVLLTVAAAAHDSDLPDALLARAATALARSRRIAPATLRARLAADAIGMPAERAALAALVFPGRSARQLASRHAALEQVGLIWSDIAGVDPGERMAALIALLPRLSGIAQTALRARLTGGARSGNSAVSLPRSLALLPLSGLRRVALLLGLPKTELRRLSHAAAIAKVANRIGGKPAASADEIAPAPEATDEPRADGDATPRARASYYAATVASGRIDAAFPPPSARNVPSTPVPGTRERPTATPAWDIPHAGATLVRRGATRGNLRDGDRIAALIRARPFATLRLLANAADAPARLTAFVQDPQAPGLLFAAMAPAERARASLLMRLLTGRKGRLAIAPAKVARALALAAAARDWRSGGGRGFAAEWLRQLTALASLSEQAALRRVLGALPPDDAIAPIKTVETAAQPLPPDILRTARSVLGLPANASAGAVRRALEDPRHRTRLGRELCDAELVRLLAALAPTAAAGLLHAAERLAAARRAAGAPLVRAAQWDCILAAAGTAHPIPQLTARFLDGVDATPPLAAPTRNRVEALLSTSLEGMRDAPLRIALDLRARERKARAAQAREGATESAQAIHIGNAGLVLASAFLPRLFQSLDYVAEGPEGVRWTDAACPARAVHLLQWLVDARTDAPEPQLALNKILCGLDPSAPVPAAVTLTADELRMGRTLLTTILAGWPPLADSGAEALRETFFQREGRLTQGENGWSLAVETRVLDILLDQLPWGYSTILHRWMRAPLTVQWR